MRALRVTLILFGLIFVTVSALAVYSAAQPRAAELIVKSTDGLITKTSDEGEPYAFYIGPSAETAPPPTGDAAETPQPENPAVTAAPAPTEEPGTPAWIIGLYVNLREGPGTGYDVIGTYDYGTPLRILDTVGNWAHILIEGKEGYMTLNLIDTQRPDDTEDEPPGRTPASGTNSGSGHVSDDPYADGAAGPHTHSWTTTTVHHPAETHTIYHDAVYKTVHHDAVYDEEDKLITEAWDEEVLVTPAWREHVVDTPAWIEKVTVCGICGQTK